MSRKNFLVRDGYTVTIDDGDEEMYYAYLSKPGWGEEELYEFPKFATTYEEFLENAKSFIPSCIDVVEKDREWEQIVEEAKKNGITEILQVWDASQGLRSDVSTNDGIIDT